MRCSFAAQSNFRSIDSIHARLTARSATGGDDYMSGKETELHQAAGYILGEIEAIEGARFALLELSESHLQH